MEFEIDTEIAKEILSTTLNVRGEFLTYAGGAALIAGGAVVAGAVGVIAGVIGLTLIAARGAVKIGDYFAGTTTPGAVFLDPLNLTYGLIRQMNVDESYDSLVEATTSFDDIKNVVGLGVKGGRDILSNKVGRGMLGASDLLDGGLSLDKLDQKSGRHNQNRVNEILRTEGISMPGYELR